MVQFVLSSFHFVFSSHNRSHILPNTWWNIWPKYSNCSVSCHPAAVFSLDPFFPCLKSSFPFCLSCDVEMLGCLPHITGWKSSQIFFLLHNHRSGLLKLCSSSDSDEFFYCFRASLFLLSFECRREQYEEEMKPPSCGFIQFAISLSRCSQYSIFGMQQKRMTAGASSKMQFQHIQGIFGVNGLHYRNHRDLAKLSFNTNCQPRFLSLSIYVFMKSDDQSQSYSRLKSYATAAAKAGRKDGKKKEKADWSISLPHY